MNVELIDVKLSYFSKSFLMTRKTESPVETK